jgi:hypothetical protein
MHRRQSRGQRQGIDTNAMGIHERVDTDINGVAPIVLSAASAAMAA